MSRRRLAFRPRLLPSLVTALLLPVLLGLGFWQLDRADQKREIIEARQAAAEAPAVDLNAGLPTADDARFRLAGARGRFDGERQFLLENQVRDGVLGYRIITPLRLEGGHEAILVDRGWVAAPASRRHLPDTRVDSGEREVTGRLGKGPSVGLRMGPAYAGDGGWPRRVQYLDFEAMDEALPYAVPHYLLRTGAGAAEARPEGMRFGPERHHGYAVQWFALATALVVIYIGVNLRRRKDHEQHS
ncbi:SURF1 family protein [Arhodomonas sp. SL1]|uniref:SURF1 family protein n=1 Tax=Arhodomonas sp. SL1 TaxID=3425691 RepID=UPI003F8811F7